MTMEKKLTIKVIGFINPTILAKIEKEEIEYKKRKVERKLRNLLKRIRRD